MYEGLVKRLLSYADLHCPLDRSSGICGCIDAREAAEAILELRKPRWVPVTELLPKPGEESLVLVSKSGMDVALYEEGFYGEAEWFTTSGKLEGVTHWMPLPQPPEEET